MTLTKEEVINEIKNFNKERVVEAITRFIKQKVTEAKANGAVIGLSGGIDSSVTTALTALALGSEKVTILLMPHGKFTPKQDMEDAYKVIELFGIKKVHEINIESIADSYRSKLEESGLKLDKVSYGNLLPRIRMTLLYSYANQHNLLVIGSGDKSEILIGYFTKYGDGGADIFPIGDLYKTRVRVLGEHLSLPKNVVEKPSSPRLWEDHLAESELGATYEDIDTVLYGFMDLRLPLKSIYNIEGLDPRVIDKVIERLYKTEHKRMLPPIPRVFGGLAVGTDWRAPHYYELNSGV